ncbi:hypothetical protein PG993_010170 [Apiospora rasikravindrae]|uniref:Uncharacterized protein n=1 Tax=Apiospora rasikravindrae TaxID=990691 RepID=A0ABR1SLG8_9PEZI
MAGEPFVRLPPRPHGQPPQHQGPPPQQHGPPLQHPIPPPPPPEAIPLDLRFRGPVVEVKSVRYQAMSHADMVAKCTDFAAQRYEKCNNNSSHPLDWDDEDASRSPWEETRRTRVTSLSQKQLLKEVRRLDLETKSVLEKKAELSPTLQQQIDLSIHELAAGEHDPANYQWTLAQIDQQLKRIYPATTRYRTEHPAVTRPHGNGGRKHYKHECKKHHEKKTTNKSRTRNKSKPRRVSSSRKTKHASCPPREKVYMERVSLTAYFKRAPRPDVDVVALLDSRSRARMMTQPATFHQQQDPRAGGPPHAASRSASYAASYAPPGPPPLPAVGNGGGGGKGKPPKVIPQSESGSNSDGSSSTDDSSSDSGWSDGESTLTGPTQTSSTTNSSSRAGGRDKRGCSHSRGRDKKSKKKNDKKDNKKGKAKGRSASRSRSRRRGTSRRRRRPPYYESSSAFGISNRPFRTHWRPDHPYRGETEPYPLPRLNPDRPPQPPRPAPVIVQQPSQIEIERIKDKAYISGREDEKKKNRVLDEMSSDDRPARRLSRTRTGVRHVERPEPRRETYRETRRERVRVPRHSTYPSNIPESSDCCSSASYFSTDETATEYEPDYRPADNRHSARTGGVVYDTYGTYRHHSPLLSTSQGGAYRVRNTSHTRSRADGHGHCGPYTTDTHHITVQIDDPPYRPPEPRTGDYSLDRDEMSPRRMNPFEPQVNHFGPRVEPRFGTRFRHDPRR